MPKELRSISNMKAITACWIAGVIFVAGLSVGCSSGSGGNKTSGVPGTNPYGADKEMQKYINANKPTSRFRP
jgi:hypothetical protein